MVELVRRLLAAGISNPAVAEALRQWLQSRCGVGVVGNARKECRAKDPSRCRTHGNAAKGEDETDAKHTPKELVRMARFEASVDRKAVEWRDAVLAASPAERTQMAFKFGECGDKMASDIQRLVGIDTKGWAIEIQGNHVTHINNRHGVGGAHDKTMADANNFGRIGFAIKNYDDVRLITPSSAYSQNGGEHSPQIALLTKVDGTMVVSEAVPNTRKRTIQITTAYFTKQKISEMHL